MTYTLSAAGPGGQVAEGFEGDLGERPPLARVGDAWGRLLAGPGRPSGAERLDHQLARLGTLPLAGSRAAMRATIEASGLTGRGGGEYLAARKLPSSPAASPIVVVNASEGEPASRKDRTLLELRPHLVLDGAAFEAAAAGSDDVVIYLDPAFCAARSALERALSERRAGGLDDPAVTIVEAPPGYLAGESSAVMSHLEGSGGTPVRHRPRTVRIDGIERPVVVNNAETVAHLSLISRSGAAWFRRAGSPRAPGSTLVTLAGSVSEPGTVVEVVGTIDGATLLRTAGGLTEMPEAVLVGGYGGRFVTGAAFAGAPLDRDALRLAGIPLGCGLVAPLEPDSCGLAAALRLLTYLAGESAGQCAPCIYGLPALAEDLRGIIEGRASRRAIRRLQATALSVVGQGACHHPDGAAALVESALLVFGADALAHARGRPCTHASSPGWFPTPSPTRGLATSARSSTRAAAR